MGDSIWGWSATAADNGTADTGINFAEYQAPSTVNDSNRTLMKRIKDLLSDLAPARTSGGTATAYTVTSSSVGTALVDGQMIEFLPHVTCGDNPTLNVASKGAKPWRDRYATSGGIAAGRVVLGVPVRATYRAAIDAWITSLGGPDIPFIRSSITRTVGGVAPDFVSLADAAAWFESVVCGLNGFVTLQLASGVTTAITAPVVFRSPYLDRLTIQGAAMVGARPVRSDFTVTGVAQSADRTAQAAMLRARYATEVAFSGANGWLGFVGPLPTIKDILFTSNRTTLSGVAGLVVFNLGGQIDGCAVHGAGGAGFAGRDGLLQILTASSASGCTSSGLALADGAAALMRADLSLVSNDVAGFAYPGAFFRRSSGYLGIFGSGSGVFGTNAGGAEIYGPQTEIGYCTVGINVQHADCNVSVGGAVIHHCDYGVYNEQGRVTAPSTVFGTIAINNGYATDGGVNRLTGSSGGSGTYSPSANTVGNSNSYNHV